MQKFGEMSVTELEKWEKETNSVVLFDVSGGKAIAFQKSANAIVVQSDIKEGEVIILEGEEIKRLKEFIDSKV